MLHVICETSGLSFPPPGIDDYYSATIKGVGWIIVLRFFDSAQNIDRTRPYLVPVSIQPVNGVHRLGDAISVTFATEVMIFAFFWQNSTSCR
jgi:hypothetical protein